MAALRLRLHVLDLLPGRFNPCHVVSKLGILCPGGSQAQGVGALHWDIFIAYAAGLFLVYAVARLLLVPILTMLRLLTSAVVGGLLLYLANLLGNLVGIHIPINPITALVVGFLGVPGLLLVFVLKLLLAN